MRGLSNRWLHAAWLVAVLLVAGLVSPPAARAQAPACKVENLAAHRTYLSKDGQALRTALSRGRDVTLRITGVCVGNYTISHQQVTLVGRPTRDVPTSTLRNPTGVRASVLHITGRSSVVIKDLRITGGTGTLIRLLGPEPILTAAGGGILQDGGALTLRGHTVVDHNSAISGSQPLPGVDGMFVTAGAGGAVFTRDAVVRMLDDTRISDNASVSGQFLLGGGGGVYVATGTVTLRDRARITANSASGAMVAEPGVLVLAGASRIDANYGGGDGDPAGGGVISSGRLALQEGASIDHNEAFWGGGVFNEGLLTLSGHARIADNTGWLGGGGVSNNDRVAIAPTAAITGNRTGGAAGGGVLNWGSAILRGTSRVMANIPDDIAQS